jgi:hypothetical protein
MSAPQYLDEYVRELKRDGEAAFRSRHGSPVLIVTQAGGDLHGGTAENTVMASSSGWRLQELTLLNRVFRIQKGTFDIPGPVTLGRAENSDISISEESISKRHCSFEPSASGVTLTDLGSTNGTSVDGKAIHGPHLLKGGEVLAVGNFSFLFQTPDSLVAYLHGLGG